VSQALSEAKPTGSGEDFMMQGGPGQTCGPALNTPNSEIKGINSSADHPPAQSRTAVSFLF
jgi:hypothetical protein